MRYLTTRDGTHRYTVEHHRMIGGGTLMKMDAMKAQDVAATPKGGFTVVTIVGPNDEVLAKGRADCNSDLDNFNAKLGHQIALGRAIAELDGTAVARAQRRAERDAARRAEKAMRRLEASGIH